MIGRFALLTMLDVGDTEVDTLIQTFSTVMTELARYLANAEQSKNRGSQMTYRVCVSNEKN